MTSAVASAGSVSTNRTTWDWSGYLEGFIHRSINDGGKEVLAGNHPRHQVGPSVCLVDECPDGAETGGHVVVAAVDADDGRLLENH